MTIISSKDLDAQMSRQIDPNSVPKHIGGDQGVMQGVINRGTDAQEIHQGAGRDGAAVYNESEVGGQFFYGSKTIISVNDAPPLPDKFEPKPAAPKPVVAAFKAATPGALSPALMSALARRSAQPVAAPAPAPAPAPSITPASLDMIKRMGLLKPKP
jgi:hypothetical protein